MAKATFQRNQKVWVESVGAWSVIERIVPVWAKGFEEPVKVTYDVGFGREFHAHELKPEQDGAGLLDDEAARWRLLRARNKWQTAEDCRDHPFPGTYPVVVTDANDWGGWRVPGAEYDRDPVKIEAQARLITQAPTLMALARRLMNLVDEAPQPHPELVALAQAAAKIERYVTEIPAGPEETQAEIVQAAE